MGILRRLFGNPERAPSAGPETMTPRPAARPRADYSFVRAEHGRIVGIWLADPSKADPSAMGYIETLLMVNGASDQIGAARRIVPNRVDDQGGCFVMFGGMRAPGE